MTTRAFQIHNLSTDTIREIRILAARLGLTHAQVVEQAIRAFLLEGR
jgi:hypothetical protein